MQLGRDIEWVHDAPADEVRFWTAVLNINADELASNLRGSPAGGRGIPSTDSGWTLA